MSLWFSSLAVLTFSLSVSLSFSASLPLSFPHFLRRLLSICPSLSPSDDLSSLRLDLLSASPMWRRNGDVCRLMRSACVFLVCRGTQALTAARVWRAGRVRSALCACVRAAVRACFSCCRVCQCVREKCHAHSLWSHQHLSHKRHREQAKRTLASIGPSSLPRTGEAVRSYHSAYRALVDRHTQGGGRECRVHAVSNSASKCLQLRSMSGTIPLCNSRELGPVCASVSGC